MSTDQNARLVSLPANADLSTSQYLLAALTNSSGVARVSVCGDGAQGIGVIYEATGAVAGDVVAVGVNPGSIYKVKAGATMATAGINVASDASGKLVAAATGDYILGRLLTAAAADGDIVEFLFQPLGKT